MWKDISSEVKIEKALFAWKDKLVYHCQVIGELSRNYIAVFVPGYRVRLERDTETNRFFIEKDFETHELQDKAIRQEPSTSSPFIVVRKMKFLEFTIKDNMVFINADAIVMIERLMANKCKVMLESGMVLEVDYDAKRIRQKLEELEPDSVVRV